MGNEYADRLREVEAENERLRSRLAESERREAEARARAEEARKEIDGPGGWRELAKGHEHALAFARTEAAELRKAAQALIDYETAGAPDFPEWDRYFDALRAALAPREKTP